MPVPPTAEPPPRIRVLVVEDDATVAEIVVSYLRDAGMEVVGESDGDRATAHLTDPPDVAVLDVMLPGRDGIELCRDFLATGRTRVVLLTALGDEPDRVRGLELGADDYVTKPFSPRELVLRVQAVARRGMPSTASRTVAAGPLTVDTAARTATRDGDPLALTVREFDLLAFLVAHPAVAFTRAELMERVWGWSYGDQSTVTVHVRRLREKIEVDPARPRLLETVWGVGYRLGAGVRGSHE